MTTSYCFGLFTLTNLLFTLTSTLRQSRLLDGVPIKIACSQRAEVRRTATLGFGIRILCNHCTQLILEVKFATWCSVRIHKRLYPRTAIVWTRSFCGNFPLCRKFKHWQGTNIEFYTWVWVQMGKTLSQGQETRPCAFGMLFLEPASWTDNRASCFPRAWTCDEQAQFSAKRRPGVRGDAECRTIEKYLFISKLE